MSGYAEKTTVSVERSRAEIEATVRKYGGDRFCSLWLDDQTQAIGFRIKGYWVRFDLKMPTEAEERVSRTATGLRRSEVGRKAALDAEERRRWRVLLLRIKARLEEVTDYGVPVRDAFMANLVLPAGETVSEKIGVLITEEAGDTAGAPTLPLPGSRPIALGAGR